MPSTRRSPAVEIYQDEPDTALTYMQSSTHHPQPHLRSGMRPPPHLAPSAMPLQSVHNPPTTSHVMPHGMLVGAPVSMPPGLSPTKRPMYGPPVTNLHMMPVMPPVTTPQMMAAMTQSPIEDNFNAAYYGQPTFKPMPPQPMYSMWNLNSSSQGQESMHNAMVMPENAPYPAPNPRKRSNSDAASIIDRPNKKRRGEPESHFVLPEPHEMPPVEDPGDKPSYSYAMMIGMAILRSPNRQLTLSGIYGWIQDSFTYYRNQELGAGWQNSIRHNLSLSKAFKKRPRPKEDTGKGCYWYISEGEEAQFMTQRTRKGAATGNMIVQHDTIGQQAMQVMAPVSHEQLQPQHWMPPVSTHMPPPLQRPQTAPAPEQLRHIPLTEHLPTVSTPNHPPLPLLDAEDDDDSDATIPASDTILEESDAPQLPANFLTLQDLPADALNKQSVSIHVQPIIGSSPPILLHSNRRQSSPAEFLPPVLPMKGPRRRNPVTVNDSGYHSDFQSSARKRNQQSSKGRQTDHDFSAQAEIMRMRSSPSYQSHVHMRAAVDLLTPATPAYGSSVSKRNPITPRLLGVPPVQFLASVSPTGQLHNFRHQFQESPTRGTSELQNISPTGEVEDFFGNAFHPHEMSTGTPLLSSPFKVPNSSKRPGIFRSNTTTAVLSDVTKQVRNKQNARTPSKVPVLKPSVLSSLARTASPMKTDLTQQLQFPGIDYGSEDENFDMAAFLHSDRDYENEDPNGKTENEASELSDGYDLANGFPMIAGKTYNDDDYNENNDPGATMKAKASTTRHGIRRHISSLI